MELGTELWAADDLDLDGTVTFRVLAQADKLAFVVADDDGTVVRIAGLELGRADVRRLRQVLTSWLIDVEMGDLEP